MSGWTDGIPVFLTQAAHEGQDPSLVVFSSPQKQVRKFSLTAPSFGSRTPEGTPVSQHRWTSSMVSTQPWFFVRQVAYAGEVARGW